MVITINNKEQFPTDMTNAVTATEKISIENETSNAITKIYSNNRQVYGFSEYILMHHQKLKIEGTIWNRDFNHVLRRFSMRVFEKQDMAHIITVSSNKGSFAHQAFKRLSKSTPVKCTPIEIDLIQALPLIVTNNIGITVTLGWFSQIGLPNLNNVLLQGTDVNESADWIRFRDTVGAKLSNIELLIEDDAFQRGTAKVSLSARGFLYSKTSMSDEKCLEIATRVLNIVSPCITV